MKWETMLEERVAGGQVIRLEVLDGGRNQCRVIKRHLLEDWITVQKANFERCLKTFAGLVG
jgi:hypothetical protein